MVYFSYKDKKNLCTKSKGFTLMELVVTMAVSSIFFVILGTVLMSVYRCYNQSMELSNEQIEFNTVVQLIDKSFEEINKEGRKVKISKVTLDTDNSIQELVLQNDLDSTMLKIMKQTNGFYAITYKISTSPYLTEYVNSIMYSPQSNDLIEFQMKAIKKSKIQLQTTFSYRILGGITA